MKSEITKNWAEYWPCACVKRDRAGKMKAIKMIHNSKTKCRKCGCTKPDPAAKDAATGKTEGGE
jgi:hypothetical protein